MKKQRFTEEQIIGILREQGGRREDGGFGSRIRDFAGDALQLESQIWRHGGFRGQASKGAGGGKRSAEEAVGGLDA